MKRNLKLFLGLSLLALILVLAGCGGGGGSKKNDSPPTSANLRAAGEQIVVDTRMVWGSSENLIQSKLTELLQNVETQIDLDVIGNASFYAFYPLNFSFLEKLFCLTEGTYNVEEVLESTPTGIYKNGPWTVHVNDYERGGFDFIVNRSVNGLIDQVTYSITKIGGQPVDYYDGVVSYPTALLSDSDSDGTISVTVNMSDDNLEQSKFTGELNRSTGGPASYYGDFTGEFDYQFKNSDKFLKLNGNLVIPGSDQGELLLSGAIDTKDLKFTGSIKTSYLKNDKSNEYIPSKLILEGLIEDKTETAISLGGTLTAEIKNAKNIDPKLDNSPSNLYHYFFEFQGTVGVGASHTTTTFTVEETDFECYSLNIIHSLSNSGVNRQCSLNITNTDDRNAKIEINSTWGPATVLMDLALTESGEVSLVSGEVKVSGTPVGTISYDDSLQLIKVTYKDGSFETF